MNIIVKQLNIKNKCECYTKEENIIRKAIMEFIIDNGRAFHIKDDIDLLNVELDDYNISDSIKNLTSNNGFVLNENNEVIFIYPVSAVPTNHLVTLKDGRKFNAMCAIDAMGTAFTFHQDISLKSKCSNTDADIEIEIKDGKLESYSPEDIHVLHVDLNKYSNWGTTC